LEGETNTEKQTLTRIEAANYLGIHLNTLDKSSIPRVRIGRRVLFNRKTLEKLLGDKEQNEGHVIRRKN